MSGDCEFRFSTLSERTLHRAVKDYLEPDRQYQEVPVAGFVADIFRDGQLLEVQTGSVTPLVKKLLRLPKEYPVTIVLPIVREKTLVTLSEEGELLSRRRSPKKGGWWEAYYQLPRLLPLAERPGVRLRLILVDADEYRTETPSKRVGRSLCRRLDRCPPPLVRNWTWPSRRSLEHCFRPGCPTRLHGRNCGSSPGFRCGA